MINSLSKTKTGRSKRCSSYDRTGGNRDYFVANANKSLELCSIKSAGIINHIWVTLGANEGHDNYLYRKVILRAYWDNEENPSIEVPIGDFFGMGHGIAKNFSSACLAMSPQDGRSFNCFFPMPFSDGARFVICNEANVAVKIYFYIDYVELPFLPEDELRFHACWNRQCPTDGIPDDGVDNTFYEFGGKNTTGEGNYVILDAKGNGHYVGCNFNIHNLRATNEWNWYGEGDDMIFIDGEKWPPSLHGTGTEDYFNTAWCPQQEICTPYHGIIMGGGPNWSGKITLYRYHITDAIIFNKSIRVTIEHGHNNHRSDDISSTAYWYQNEPHMVFKPILPVEQRLPMPDILPFNNKMLGECFNYDNP